MPEKLKKLPNGRFQVSGPSGIHSKGTTKQKAQAQIRIIEAADKKKKK